MCTVDPAQATLRQVYVFPRREEMQSLRTAMRSHWFRDTVAVAIILPRTNWLRSDGLDFFTVQGQFKEPVLHATDTSLDSLMSLNEVTPYKERQLPDTAGWDLLIYDNGRSTVPED